MKRSEVKIGGVYIAKVTNRLVQVRIDAKSRYGGWEGINLRTGINLRIRSATRLRSAVSTDTIARNGEADKEANTTTEAHPAPTSTPVVKNVADTEPVQVACPNCGSTKRNEDSDCAKCHGPKCTGKEATVIDVEPPASKKAKPTKPKRPSGLNAAAKILEETGVPMDVKEIVEVAFAKGYWKPAGRTPSATLAAALIREIARRACNRAFANPSEASSC